MLFFPNHLHSQTWRVIDSFFMGESLLNWETIPVEGERIATLQVSVYDEGQYSFMLYIGSGQNREILALESLSFDEDGMLFTAFDPFRGKDARLSGWVSFVAD